jgi:acetyl-CoA C-acetyltransferase
VTGGLTFAGGPWNNYVSHGVATMVDRLRRQPDAYGLCTANGGNLTKHAAGIYAARPPAAAPRFGHPQRQVDATPDRRAVPPSWTGPARMEAWTVMHDRGGDPEVAFAYGRTVDGARVVGASRDPHVVSLLSSGKVDSDLPLEWVAGGAFTIVG